MKINKTALIVASVTIFPMLGSFVEAKSQIPRNFVLHVPGYKKTRLDESEWRKPQYNRWHYMRDQGREQVLRVWGDGKDPSENNSGRIRTEAHTGKDRWNSNGPNDWYEYQATTKIFSIGGREDSALLQMKDPEVSIQWEFIMNMGPKGDLRLTDRTREPGRSFVLSKNSIVGRAFTIRTRSNGNRYQIFYNGRFLGSRTHSKNTNYTADYAWRWGFYTQTQVKGKTSSRVVYNLSFD